MASKAGIEGSLASVSVDSGNGQKAETEASRLLKIGPFSIWALGITIVIGGQMFSWNQMLVSGFGSTIISVIMVGTAYICLCLCNSEMTSALPFAGGAYGLARVTLGLQAGFLIGCCESMQYILYVAASFRFLAEITASICNTSKFTVPIYSAVYYIIACTILIIGGNFFWQISTVFGMVSLLIIVMYCLGSLPFVDISRYAPDPGTTGIYSAEYNKQWFIGGMGSFMYTLPLASWFFVGVESLSLCGSVVREPKLSIPIGSLSCVSILFISSIFIVCVCSSLPPDDSQAPPLAMSAIMSPFDQGFMLMFKMPKEHAQFLSLPAMFATGYGFIFAYSRVMISMARSGLFPKIFLMTYGRYRTPYMTVLSGSLIGYIVLVATYFRPVIGNYLYDICILQGFIAYICQCMGYIIYKVKFDTQPKLFSSPLGIYGAIYAIAVFGLSAIGVLAFQNDQGTNAIVVIVSLFVYTIYYYNYAKKRQKISPEEKVFFPVHVVKYNTRSRRSMHKGSLMVNKSEMDRSIIVSVKLGIEGSIARRRNSLNNASYTSSKTERRKKSFSGKSPGQSPLQSPGASFCIASGSGGGTPKKGLSTRLKRGSLDSLLSLKIRIGSEAWGEGVSGKSEAGSGGSGVSKQGSVFEASSKILPIKEEGSVLQDDSGDSGLRIHRALKHVRKMKDQEDRVQARIVKNLEKDDSSLQDYSEMVSKMEDNSIFDSERVSEVAMISSRLWD